MFKCCLHNIMCKTQFTYIKEKVYKRTNIFKCLILSKRYLLKVLLNFQIYSLVRIHIFCKCFWT